MSNQNCETCKLYVQEQQGCVHWQRKVNIEDFCSHWTDKLPTCQLCGRPFMQSETLLEEGSYWITLCPECAHSLGQCSTCVCGDRCAFAQDQSIQIPPFVQRQFRQGNSIVSTQVKNPERVKLTCEKCPCYVIGATDAECYCQKEENHFCPKYRMKGILNL